MSSTIDSNSVIEVKIAIAVSEWGEVRCIPVDSCDAQRIEAFRNFKKELLEDDVLWTMKLIKTHVPAPISSEDVQ